jgi:lipopolysaccharide/colanic/teichoic acid biosynthesis glycosyltransferase
VALLLLWPLMLLMAAFIYLEDHGPVFYNQLRTGRGFREFDLRKFRSMRLNNIPVEQIGQVRQDHPFVTRIGRLIRRFKIDELPQLFNVLRGQMSLVGPRPAIPEQALRYNDFERRRLRMRPGMTGWAQVNGNIELSWQERILLDVWYVDHWSLGLDLAILVRTIGVVLRGERPGVNALREAMAYADHLGRSG